MNLMLKQKLVNWLWEEVKVITAMLREDDWSPMFSIMFIKYRAFLSTILLKIVVEANQYSYHEFAKVMENGGAKIISQDARRTILYSKTSMRKMIVTMNDSNPYDYTVSFEETSIKQRDYFEALMN